MATTTADQPKTAPSGDLVVKHPYYPPVKRPNLWEHWKDYLKFTALYLFSAAGIYYYDFTTKKRYRSERKEKLLLGSGLAVLYLGTAKMLGMWPFPKKVRPPD